MSTHSQGYRADIDGLRALAVLSVVIFHINPAWMGSGFLGVDMFFVLSGYLITSLIYREMRAGTFSFARFYMRRIKRILPAFFFVLFVTLGLGYLLLLPRDLMELTKSAIAGVMFVANFFFMRGVGYFDTSSEMKPLLHIWSLSIEEQFYFLFPLFLLLLLRMRFIKNKILMCIIVIGGVLHYIYSSVVGFAYDSYYFSHLRFPELLVGSVLAIWSSDRRVGVSCGPGAMYGSTLALAILLACMFSSGVFVSPLFPGPLSLIPCVATAALLYYNQSSHWVTRFFSLRPVVWVGKISYSLYLWHWVILAYMRYVYGEGELTIWATLFSVGLMLGLSVLSFYCVEQPIRRREWTLVRSLGLFYLLPASIVVVSLWGAKSAEAAFPKDLLYPDHGSMCFDTLEGKALQGDSTKPAKILVAGDSHTGHLVPFLDKVGKREGWCAFVSAASSGPFLLDISMPAFYKENLEFRKVRYDFLSREYKRYPVIVLADFWGSRYYHESPYFLPALQKTLEELIASGKQVYMLNSMYNVNSQCITENFIKQKRLWIDAFSKEVDKYGEVNRQSRAHAEQVKQFVAQHFPQVHWVDLTPLLPIDLMYKGRLILADHAHLNQYGSEALADIFIEKGERLIDPSYLE